MYERIVVLLDGSSASEKALPVAAQIARASGASLHLLRIIDFVPGHVDDIENPLIETALDFWESAHAESEAAQQELATLAGSLEQGGLRTQVTVAVGDAADVIRDRCTDPGSALTVMVAHHATTRRSWLVRSVIAGAIRRSACPTLVVHEPAEGDELAPINGVIALLDGSSLSEQCLRHASSLADCFEASLMLLKVVSPTKAVPDDDMGLATRAREALHERALDSARDYLDTLAGGVAKGEREIGREVVLAESDPVQTVLERQGTAGDVVVALCDHRRSRLLSLFRREMVDKVVMTGAGPVLVVPDVDAGRPWRSRAA